MQRGVVHVFQVFSADIELLVGKLLTSICFATKTDAQESEMSPAKRLFHVISASNIVSVSTFVRHPQRTNIAFVSLPVTSKLPLVFSRRIA